MNGMIGAWLGYGDSRRHLLYSGSNHLRASGFCRQFCFLFLQTRPHSRGCFSGRRSSGRLAEALRRRRFSLVALTGFFAALDLRAVFDVARFRFESFSAVLFAFARIVLLAFRVICVFDAGLLLLTRFRALDEGAAFGLRFDLGFAVETAPVFFVFELVVFFDYYAPP